MRGHVLTSGTAHLFVLYPYLCELLATLAKSGRNGSTSVDIPVGASLDGDDEKVVDLVRGCLYRVGQTIGIL
jgi:hypothetical protein